MRIESSVTSVSWIPREAIEGMVKLPFELGVAHYDLPPPDRLDDLEGLLASSAIRFANELRAWIEVDDNGRVTGYGHLGRGHMGHTRMRLAGIGLTFCGVSFPDLRGEPEVGDGVVRFTQTAGGQPGMPSPRRVRRRPYLQVSGPVVWSTLALSVRADGTASFEVIGASSFPRHWIYGHDGTLQAKTGLIDFDTWYRESFGEKNPWGDEESPTVVTAVETELERELSAIIIGSDPPFRRLRTGEVLRLPGRARGRALSPLRRGPGRRAGRPDGGRGRPRGHPWRDGAAGGGPAHGHPAGGDPLPGGGRARRPGRPGRPGRGGPAAPGRGVRGAQG